LRRGGVLEFFRDWWRHPSTEVIKLILGKALHCGRLLLVEPQHALPRTQAAQNPECPFAATIHGHRTHRLPAVCGMRRTPEQAEERHSPTQREGTEEADRCGEEVFILDVVNPMSTDRHIGGTLIRRTTCRSAWPRSTATAKSWCSAQRRALPAHRRVPQAVRLSRVVNLAGGILAGTTRSTQVQNTSWRPEDHC